MGFVSVRVVCDGEATVSWEAEGRIGLGGEADGDVGGGRKVEELYFPVVHFVELW